MAHSASALKNGYCAVKDGQAGGVTACIEDTEVDVPEELTAATWSRCSSAEGGRGFDRDDAKPGCGGTPKGTAELSSVAEVKAVVLLSCNTSWATEGLRGVTGERGTIGGDSRG